MFVDEIQALSNQPSDPARVRFPLSSAVRSLAGAPAKLELEACLKAIFDAFGRLPGGVHEESYAFA